MGKTHLFFTDVHCKPGESNDHASLLLELVKDVKPDVLVCGGDLADMESLCSYDKGTRAAVGRNYQGDVESAVDFNDRLIGGLRKLKKKMPKRVLLIGNHEQRIERALDIHPHLEGTIDMEDLQYHNYYDIVVEDVGSTPSMHVEDGVTYAHYFPSGIMGNPIGGFNQASMMLQKNHVSCVAGHSHLQDHAVRTTPQGRRVIGLVGGCFVNYEQEWAGTRNNMWWKGVTVLRNVDGGSFDTQFISLESLRKEYA